MEKEKFVIENGKITVFNSLPEEVASLLKEKKMKIAIDKTIAEKFIDQTSALAASDGCISEPGGPHC